MNLKLCYSIGFRNFSFVVYNYSHIFLQILRKSNRWIGIPKASIEEFPLKPK